jgi:hypothetical protein
MRFVDGWSGATPNRTSPPGTDNRSISVTRAFVCSSRSCTAYIPAGPVPTTATSSAGNPAGIARSKVGGPQSWNTGSVPVARDDGRST